MLLFFGVFVRLLAPSSFALLPYRAHVCLANVLTLLSNYFRAQDEGMAHFVKHMGHMYLRSLDLSYNQISPAMEKMLSATVHR